MQALPLSRLQASFRSRFWTVHPPACFTGRKIAARNFANQAEDVPKADLVKEGKARLVLRGPLKRKPSSAHAPILPTLLDDVRQEPTELFKQLRTGAEQHSQILLGVDPDNSGAVAVAHLALGQPSLLEAIGGSDVDVYDMPCQSVTVGRRQRKQADPAEVVSIVKKVVQGNSAEVHAVVEQPVPGPLNGSYSIFGTGFSFGVFAGVLQSHDVPVSCVSARRWKQDMGLNKHGKEGSRALALALFPQADQLLKRKKDHGRAEALLIIAWALGVRLPSTTVTAHQLAEKDCLTGLQPEAASLDHETEDLELNESDGLVACPKMC